MDQWEFFTVRLHDNDTSPWMWRWRCRETGGQLLISEQSFRSLAACVNDARSHGFRHAESRAHEPGTSNQGRQ